jgi:hypothetical protein
MNKGELAMNYAVDFFISDFGELTHSQLLDALQNDEIPEQVSIWSPFENSDAGDLLILIDSLANTYITFVDDLSDIYDKQIDKKMKKQKLQDEYMAKIDEEMRKGVVYDYSK